MEDSTEPMVIILPSSGFLCILNISAFFLIIWPSKLKRVSNTIYTVKNLTENIPTVLSQGTVAASVELNSTPVKCKKLVPKIQYKAEQKKRFLPSNSNSGEMIFFPVTHSQCQMTGTNFLVLVLLTLNVRGAVRRKERNYIEYFWKV